MLKQKYLKKNLEAQIDGRKMVLLKVSCISSGYGAIIIFLNESFTVMIDEWSASHI